jgi:hypothetical protein
VDIQSQGENMSDLKAVLGLTRIQQMEEEDREAARMYGGIGPDIPVRTAEEAEEYAAEIMALIGAERCAICGRWYLPVDDCPLCNNCLAYERQAEQDHREEIAVAHAATNGTL